MASGGCAEKTVLLQINRNTLHRNACLVTMHSERKLLEYCNFPAFEELCVYL